MKSAINPAEHAAIVVLNETRAMPWTSIADSVLPGLKPYQPNQRISPPTAPRMMLCGSGGPPPPRRATPPPPRPGGGAPPPAAVAAEHPAQPRAERDRADQRDGAADAVHHRRAREVAERRIHRRQPAV